VAKASDGDLYEVLGVARDAGQDEIKSAYRAAVKKFHPDAEGNSYFFRLVQQAYETLSDPALRADYDRTGRQAPPAPAPSRPGAARTDQRWAETGPVVPAIPPEEITWWARVDPAARISWRARFAATELLFVGVGGLWVALVVFGLATSTLAAAGGYGYLVFGLVVAPTIWCLLGAVFGRKPTRAAVLWSIVIGVALVLLTWFAERQHISHPATIFGYALGALIIPWLAARFAPYRKRQRIDWNANMWQLRAGGQGSVVRSESAAGLTADLLARYLTRIPAVRVFRDPGIGPGVDHLVLCGRRMVLISSVAWPAGHYTVGRGGEVLLDGQPVLSGSLGIAEALRTARRRFRRAQIRGVVVNWPPRSGQYLLANWVPDADYAVTSPDALVKDVGNWLAHQPRTVHRGMFRALVTTRR
jgi:hypothetical protein